MYRKITREIKTEIITDCRCDKCKNLFSPSNINNLDTVFQDNNQLSGLMINHTAGYWSKEDGAKIELTLCENCLLDLQEQFKDHVDEDL